VNKEVDERSGELKNYMEVAIRLAKEAERKPHQNRTNHVPLSRFTSRIFE
jgi:hypothetical protein